MAEEAIVRISLLVQGYPPIIGGAEQSVCELAEGLAGLGHSVSVITLWHKGLKETGARPVPAVAYARRKHEEVNG